MDYVFTLTDGLIKALSIGNSAPETVWFWVKAVIYYRLAALAVHAFI